MLIEAEVAIVEEGSESTISLRAVSGRTPAAELTTHEVCESLLGIEIIIKIIIFVVIFGVKGTTAAAWSGSRTRGAGIVDGTSSRIGESFVGSLNLILSRVSVYESFGKFVGQR